MAVTTEGQIHFLFLEEWREQDGPEGAWPWEAAAEIAAVMLEHTHTSRNTLEGHVQMLKREENQVSAQIILMSAECRKSNGHAGSL